MTIRSRMTVIALFVALCGCQALQPIVLGESEAQLIAKRGQPTQVYRQEDGSRLLEYRSGSCGQATYMAHIDNAGRVTSYEQVRTAEKFASIPIGKADKNQVLRTIGGPAETAYLSRVDREVWSYPYKESGAWNSVMHIYFDQNGIVQRMENGQDLRFDPDTRFPFAAMRCFGL